ncbi:hypothetical protein Tco_0798511 [Tanacetum coccineum]
MGGIKIKDVGGSTSKTGGGSVGKGGGSVGRGGGGSVGRGGGSVGRGGGGSVGRGGGSTSKRGGVSGLGRGGRSTSKRGGGSGVGRGGGSVGRGGACNSKRGGRSITSKGSGSVGRGGSNSMDTEEEQFRKDQEAEREVMEEVRAAREKERLENEQYARTYCDWEDLQWEGDGFEEPDPNLRLATMSDLVAADEAHDEHFNNMPSLTNDVSLDVSHTVEGNNDALLNNGAVSLNVALPINVAVPNNVVVPNNEQPTPDAAQTSNQSSRVVLHPRPRSERIAKRRKVNLAAGTDNPFTLAKQLALYEHEGGLIEHYGKLWEYRQVVLESNPGSTCHIDQEVLEDDGKIHFTRMYVCFKGLKDGWLTGCRRVIGLDGCFLTHYCKGELLTAVGRDANNQMFPIAWAVIKVENKNNWCWFLSLLCDDLDLQDGLGITIISDGHKGLIEAVKTWLHEAEHRHCNKHIYANFKKKWTGVLYKRLFWAAASSTVEQNFLNHMDEIKRLDPEAYAYLMGREPGSCRLVNARGKPIITMLEDIRVYVMQRNWALSKQASELDDNICPSIRKKLNILKKQQRSWQVFPSGYQVLEVRKKDEAYGVNLIERSCVCKLWGISGIPCVHAVASYMHLHMDPDLGVSSWYSQSKWFDSYQFSIKPVSGSKMWKSTSNTPSLPLLVPKMPRRPRKKRIRHPTENDHEVSRLGRLMTCHLCYETGHNKSSCTRGQQPKLPKPCKPPSNKKYSRMGGIKITDVGWGLVGRDGGFNYKKRGASGLGKKRSTSKRGGGLGVGRVVGSVSRGGGSVGRGGGSEEQFRKDQEAQREVMEEVKEAREKERLENEQYARTYCDWQDLQWEGDGFEEPNPNLRLATMSDLVAADEARSSYW